MKENIRTDIPTLSLEQLDLLSKLRKEVSCDLMLCKRALVECDWDIDKASNWIEKYLKTWCI